MEKKNHKYFLLASAILVGLTFFIFWPVFLKNLIPFPGDFLLAWYEPWKSSFNSGGTITIAHKPVADDIFRQILPFKVLAADLFKDFSLPLWNPYNGAGMPLMASMHIGFLTIFNLLFVLFPAHIAWSFYIMLQPFLIGIFTYLFCRKIGLSFQAAIFSSLTFVLSGFVITRLIFGEYIYTLSMLPLLLFLLEFFFQKNNTRLILLLPVATFFLFISGQPQIIFYVLLFCFSYSLYRIFQLKLSIRNILFILLLFLIGIGLSAVQLLPTLELFRLASINPDSSKFIIERFLLPLQHLITIFIPNYFGNQATYNYWGAADYIETMASIGLIPVFFAFLSFEGKRKMQLFFFSFAVASILLTLNWFGTRMLFSLPLPIISTGAPSRIFALTTFCISILAGYGFNNWISSTKLNKQTIVKVVIYVLLLTALLIGTFYFYKLNISCNNKFILNCRLTALRNTLLETAFFSIGLILFFLRAHLKRRGFKTIASSIVILLVIFLGVYNSTKFFPFSPKSSFMPKNNLIKFLANKTSDGRVFGFGEANVKTDFATYFRFFDPNYYDPLYNKRYGELINYANSGKTTPLKRSDIEIVNDLKISSKSASRRSRLLDILSVKYFIFKGSEANQNTLWKDNNWFIEENKSSLPRAYFVQKFNVISDDEEILKKLFDPSFNPMTTVVLEKDPKLKILNTSEENNIKITNYTENKVSLETSSTSDQILVLTDNSYPGWKAYIDGNETNIYRANYSFRSILLPKGEHSVAFIYDPASLKNGFLISSGTALIFLFFIVRPKISRNKN